MTITRGQGGQNAIGPEHYDDMGVLRTEELTRSLDVLATTVDFVRYDFDSPSRDFGFSKMWEETEEKWDFDFVIERLTYYLRLYRPQVVLIPFNFVRTQHGHHQAIYICAVRAIEAAADPAMYPEQNLPPFKPYKVYEPGTKETIHASESTGAFDPWYGKTYEQIGQYARHFHACQGMGARPLPAARESNLMIVGEAQARLSLAESKEQIFDRIPITYADYAELSEGPLNETLLALQAVTAQLLEEYPVPQNMLPILVEYQKLVEKAGTELADTKLDEDVADDLHVHLSRKTEQLNTALALAAGIQAQVIPADMTVTPNQAVKVDVRVFQGISGKYAVEDVQLKLPQQDQWTITPLPDEGELAVGDALIKSFELKAPSGEDYYNAFHADALTAHVVISGDASGLPPVFVPTSVLVKTVRWHPHSFLGLAIS